MKKKILVICIIAIALVLPFFTVWRVMDDVHRINFARPVVPLEVLALAIGLLLELTGSLRRKLHPLSLLPAAALLLIACCCLRIPMDYMAYGNSGYIVGSNKGMGALRMQTGGSPLVHLFVLDDHITLYGLLSQLLLGLMGGVMLGSLGRIKQRRFSWKPCLLALALACGALVMDGLCAWASTRVFADNWFGKTMSAGPEMMQRYQRMRLAATLAIPLVSLLLGLLAGRMELARWAKITTSIACLALVLLGTGLFVIPIHINPFDAVSTRYLPNLSMLLPTNVEMTFSHRLMPMLFVMVMPYRVLPSFLLGLLWAPTKRE